MITRDELIERLALQGRSVSVYDLENWQQAGMIPHGVRRRHNGATRLLYKPEDVDAILDYLERRKLKKNDLLRRIADLEQRVAQGRVTG